MNKFLTVLKNYWFLIIALATLSAAWGESQIKILDLETAVKQNATTQSEVSDLKAKTAVINERTKSIKETVERQERLLEKLLEKHLVSQSYNGNRSNALNR